MKIGKLNKGKKTCLAVVLQLVLTAFGFFANAQTPRRFERHDIVDVGNGQKAEIIQCRGEGPMEECDVIYYTTNRAQGTRTWENANRLRETERAAKLLTDIREGKINTLTKVRGRVNKDSAVDESIAGLTNVAPGLENKFTTGSRGSKLLDTAGIGNDTNKDVSLHKVIRRIDSVTKAKVDTFKLALQRELEIKDSIENAGRIKEERKEAAEPTHQMLDTAVKEAVPASKTEFEGSASARENSNELTPKTTARQNQKTSISSARPAVSIDADQKQFNLAENSNSALQTEKPIGNDETKAVRMNAKEDAFKTVADQKELVAPAKPEVAKEVSTVKESTPPVETSLAKASKTDKPSSYSSGDYIRTAEVKVGDSWQKAVIVDKESEYLYKVHFEGKSDKEDEWIAVSQMRNLDSTKNTQASVKDAKAVNRAAGNCSFTAPAPPVSDADKFSAKLGKRKIYEGYLDDMKTKDVSGKVGLTFLSFTTGSPFVNTVSVSATQSLVFKFAAAPAGAMVYPIKTKYVVCEQISGATTSRTVVADYACFRNKEGIWTCTGR